MPPQLITISAAIWPRPSVVSQSTPVTRAPSSVTPVTFTPSWIAAPCIRAPLASAIAMLAGSHWPSSGRCTAPTTSPTSMCGYIRFTSAGLISVTATSKARASVACRSSSSCRSLVSATEMLPTCRMPVATPVSASSLT